MPSRKKNKTKLKAKKVSSKAGKAKTSKKSAKRKPARKAAPKTRSRNRKKRASVSAEAEIKREFQSQSRRFGRRSAPRPSEELEGVSRAEQADSESVDELVEEGNLFEAGAVAGVQEADDAEEKEVQTHELLEDDVPEEYREED